MRSLRLLSGVSGASIVATAALLAACSSPSTGGPITAGYEPPSESSSGSGSGSGSSSGATSTGSSSGSTSTGSSSGATSSGSGSSGGSSSGGAVAGNTISADATWADGMTISEATTIAAGVTVTIAPGAKINVATGVAITVEGTLVATTSGTHAQLTGTSWPGLIVPKGGTITADSLDFAGASTPMDVTGTATYSNGTITAAAVPISVENGGALTLTTVTVTGSLGNSMVYGTLTASHLDYDRNGHEGLEIGDPALSAAPTAVVKIDNSTFHGTDDVTGDMIVGVACASLTMTYTTISGCHCAYHFDSITSFDLENMDLHADSYGFMAYGSSATSGTRVFKNSNVETMAAAGIDESGTNGAITVSGVYFDSSSKLDLTDQEITVSNAATAPLPATSVGPQ